MKVYKVVIENGSGYQSCRAGNFKMELPYKKGKFTIDEENGLFCFDTLTNAQDFVEHSYDNTHPQKYPEDHIFVAEAKGVRKIRYINACGEYYKILHWRKLKKRRMRIREISTEVKKGTRLASHIKLLHKVVV